MRGRCDAIRKIPLIFWALAILAIIIWSLVPGYVVGWDLDVYKAAIVSLKAGHDPYLDATTIQRAFHAKLVAEHTVLPQGVAVPFAYVYSPITLPLLRTVMNLPFAVTGSIYWLLYVVSAAITVWVGFWAAEGGERTLFAFLAPVAVFFPGLLQNDVFFSGNVACILYGAAFGAALIGWRRGRWIGFYVAVLIASCVKAPLLSLVIIPVLTARKQWLQASVTAVAGCALFAMQPHVWPELFRSYIDAVELQFSFNRDFSSSPAGLAANALFEHANYKYVSVIAYALYALPVLLSLLILRKRFLAGLMSIREWVPVVLLGTVLLNPRIMEYDVAPIALPMALVAWRFFSYGRSTKAAAIDLITLFIVVNAIAAHPFADSTWRPTEGVLLLALYVAGAWTLFRKSSDADYMAV